MYVLKCVQVLGAWGLGWEIWMDGMEITQFTYFQQVFSVMLEVVYFRRIIFFGWGVLCFLFSLGWKSSTVTDFCWNYLWSWAYTHVASGQLRLLEFFTFSFASFIRFAWSFSGKILQGVDHFKKIQYADGITYGELFLENE